MYLLLILIAWLVLSVPVALLVGAMAGGADRLSDDARQSDRPKVRVQTVTAARDIVIPFRARRVA